MLPLLPRWARGGVNDGRSRGGENPRSPFTLTTGLRSTPLLGSRLSLSPTLDTVAPLTRRVQARGDETIARLNQPEGLLHTLRTKFHNAHLAVGVHLWSVAPTYVASLPPSRWVSRERRGAGGEAVALHGRLLCVLHQLRAQAHPVRARSAQSHQCPACCAPCGTAHTHQAKI